MTTYLLRSDVSEIDDHDKLVLAYALNYGLRAFERDWALRSGTHRVALEAPQSSETIVVMSIVKTLDDPQALAYHTIDSDGNRLIQIGWDVIMESEGGLFTGLPGHTLLSVSSAIDHEIKEDAIDPYCNGWNLRADGNTMVATEVCDPCESDGYYVRVLGTKVALSNYVLPAWFDPEASAGTRLDPMGVCTQPLVVAPGGYLVALDINKGETTTEWGKAVPEWRKAMARRRLAMRMGQRRVRRVQDALRTVAP
jgi:hypothetical protein